MKKVAFLLFTFVVIMFIPERVLACQCIAPVLETEEDFRAAVSTSLDRADAVFSGEVTEMDRFIIKFRVRDVWKGDFEEEITLVTGDYVNADGLLVSSRCGPLFELGKSYLIFARGSKDKLLAERCSWTGILSEAERVVGLLDELGRTGTIPGLPKAPTVMAKAHGSLNRYEAERANDATESFCPVHKERMVQALIPIRYGAINPYVVDEGSVEGHAQTRLLREYITARSGQFPERRRWINGGCNVGVQTWATGYYCEACRRPEGE